MNSKLATKQSNKKKKERELGREKVTLFVTYKVIITNNRKFYANLELFIYNKYNVLNWISFLLVICVVVKFLFIS